MSSLNAHRMRIYACLSMVTILIFLAFSPSNLPNLGLSLTGNLLSSTPRENAVASFIPSKHHAAATSVIDVAAALTISLPTHSLPRGSSKATIAPSTEELLEESATKAVSNATLGFEKIIAINLPERSDRRDVLTLMSSLQQIDVDWQDAVKGTDMAEEAWPAHWNKGEKSEKEILKTGELGSWRSHITTLRRVVEEGYSTALILEDDADWDVTLKGQLHTFAEKTRILSDIPLDRRTYSPYGDDWDILWLGSCANPPGPPDSQIFTGENGQQHWVFRVHGGMACIYGYAVTQWAAKMLMGWLLNLDQHPDIAISGFCENHKCITVWPELIGEHRSAGARFRDSSITNYTGEFRQKGETRNIRNSAILDMLSRVGH